MNVKQLREAISGCPDEMDVYLAEVETGFKYSPVEDVRRRVINFLEEPDGKTFCKEEVVIIDSY